MYSRLYFPGTKVPVPISDGCVQPPDRNHLILNVILLLAMVVRTINPAVNYHGSSLDRTHMAHVNEAPKPNSHVSLAGTVVIINPPTISS